MREDFGGDGGRKGRPVGGEGRSEEIVEGRQEGADPAYPLRRFIPVHPILFRFLIPSLLPR